MTTFKFKPRITRIVVVPDGEPLFSDIATTVEIQDESGGEFVEVTQHCASEINKIQIDPEQWPALRETINRMVKECRDVK